MLARLIETALSADAAAEVVAGFHVIGFEFQRTAIMLFGFHVAVLHIHQATQLEMDPRQSAIQRQGLLVTGIGLLERARFPQGIAKVDMRLRAVWRERKHVTEAL